MMLLSGNHGQELLLFRYQLTFPVSTDTKPTEGWHDPSGFRNSRVAAPGGVGMPMSANRSRTLDHLTSPRAQPSVRMIWMWCRCKCWVFCYLTSTRYMDKSSVLLAYISSDLSLHSFLELDSLPITRLRNTWKTSQFTFSFPVYLYRMPAAYISRSEIWYKL